MERSVEHKKESADWYWTALRFYLPARGEALVICFFTSGLVERKWFVCL
jgi:hypothetical protein